MVAQERLEPGLADALGGRHVAHMVDHDLDRQVGQPRRQLGQRPGLDKELEVPAERLDAHGKRFDLIERDAALERGVDPQAPHPGVRHALERLVVDIGIDYGHAA